MTREGKINVVRTNKKQAAVTQASERIISSNARVIARRGFPISL